MTYRWKHSLVFLFVCFGFVLITFCLFPSPIAELGNPGYRSWPFCHQKPRTWCLLASGWCDAAGVACCCFLNASEKAVNGHFLFAFSTLNCFYKSQSHGTSTSSWESALQGSACCSCTDDRQVITLCFHLTSSAVGVPKIWVAVLGARGQRGGVTNRIAASQHKNLLPHDVFPSLAFTDGGNIAWRQDCIWNSFFLLPKPQFVQFIHP